MTTKPPRPGTDAAQTPLESGRRQAYDQGRARVSNPELVERRARNEAAKKQGKVDPDQSTPGGVTS